MLQWEGKFYSQKKTMNYVVFFIWLNRDLAVELPFTLTHPKPPPTPSPSRQFDQQNPDDLQAIDVPVDHNLIQLDAKFVFFYEQKKINFQFRLVSIVLVMMMILFSKNLLEYVLKVMKLVLMIQKLKFFNVLFLKQYEAEWF